MEGKENNRKNICPIIKQATLQNYLMKLRKERETKKKESTLYY